jgi:hypothetical protein
MLQGGKIPYVVVCIDYSKWQILWSFIMHTPMQRKYATKSGASAVRRVGRKSFPARLK